MAVGNRTMEFLITADDSEFQAMTRRVGQRFNELEQVTRTGTAQFMTLGGAVAAFGGVLSTLKLMDKALEATLYAARIETLGVVMGTIGNNAGYSKAEMDAFAESVRKMGITTEESRQTVTRMAGAHMDLTKAADLARIAQDAAVIGGTNSSEALERMIYAIISAQPEMLRSMELATNFEAAYKKMGAELGKNANDLSEIEKIQARTNAVIEKGVSIAGSYESAMGTAGKQVGSLSRYHDELKLTIGEIFTPALSEGVQGYTEMVKDLTLFINDNKSALKLWGESFADVAEFITSPIDTIRRDFEALKLTFTNFKAWQEMNSGTPVLDPSEATRLRMIKDRAESARIAAGRGRQTNNPSSADGEKGLLASWRNELININSTILSAQPGLSDLGRQLQEVDRKYDQMIERFVGAGKPGNRERIDEARRAAKDLILGKINEEMAVSDQMQNEAFLNSIGQMSSGQQRQFDEAASLAEWSAHREAWRRNEEQAEFDHSINMMGITSTVTESRLQFLGEEETALDIYYQNERMKAEAQLQWELNNTYLEESEKVRIREEFAIQMEDLEAQRAERLANLWWNNAQTYINLAQQMSTMGVQMLLFEEGQKDQIGKRMLTTSIRFIAQGLQQYMFGKAKEHVLNAAGAAGKIQTDAVAATANLGILEAQATAWAAFYSAMSLNPYGGQLFIPAATAMAGVAGGVVPSAMAAVATTGATSIATELALAAAWGLGGIAVGALGEGGASAIEGGTAGSTTPAGYGAGSPASPVVTQPVGATTTGPQMTFHINIGELRGDRQSLQRWLEEDFAPAFRDSVGRNVDFALT